EMEDRLHAGLESEDEKGKEQKIIHGGVRIIEDENEKKKKKSSEKKKETKDAKPIKIINVVEEEHSFKLNEKELESILLDKRVADKKVAVIGVAGAYRKGKSFLLNFFLRYLQWREREDLSGMDWLDPDAPLTGFSWKGGSERDTNGILLWERPFIVKDKNGEEIAVILMDTQGAFDSQSTVKDCATIFALSTMVSSLQIYNISMNIQEDDLQHLQLFTEYGRLALQDGDCKPFQSLLFLVRDWSFPYEAEFGFQGGQRLLEKRLQVSEKQHAELQQLRTHIRSCFEHIDAFLMPHPGLKVATNPNFEGKVVDIEPEFQQQLRTLVPRLLDPGNLLVKEVNGRKTTCRELVEYFKAYLKVFQGQDLPEPKNMLIATAEANNLAAVSSARAVYQRGMEEICGGEKPYMNTADLENHHERCRTDAIREFKNARKMGGADFSLPFLERLEADIVESFESYSKMNSGKNLFKSMRTPAILVAFLILNYIVQEFFQLLGLDGIAGIFSSMVVIAITALGIWCYSRYSGNMRDASGHIDQAVNWVHENFISPHSAQFGGIGGAIQMANQLQNATKTR
ncbi:hypothetical protein PMAYCL1PPCAC_18406, partial [Pristionchus mayeri]